MLKQPLTKRSFSPFYYQDVIWVAELLDGTLLREWNEDGTETLFKDIPKDKLVRFHLVSEHYDYWFNAKTGVFVVDGKRYVFPLAGKNLSYGQGLIHYKVAYQEFIRHKIHPYQGFGIASYQMGWKVTDGNVKCQVIFTVPRKEFEVQVTFLDIQKTVSWVVKV